MDDDVPRPTNIKYSYLSLTHLRAPPFLSSISTCLPPHLTVPLVLPRILTADHSPLVGSLNLIASASYTFFHYSTTLTIVQNSYQSWCVGAVSQCLTEILTSVQVLCRYEQKPNTITMESSARSTYVLPATEPELSAPAEPPAEPSTLQLVIFAAAGSTIWWAACPILWQPTGAAWLLATATISRPAVWRWFLP